MKTKFSKKILLTASVLLFVVIGAGVFALTKDDITYPIAELGNCKTEAECKIFCDKPKNAEACLDFAEKYNLMPAEDIEKAQKFLAMGEGPGGCTTEAACKSYCDDVSNIDECIDFAQEHDLISPGELAEAKKVQSALARGAKLPGGCANKIDCDTYCNDPNHMEECITFAEAAGFIPPDELADAKKMLSAIKNGAKPPPCRGKAECDVYCQEPENFESCLTFAEAAGLIPPNELAGAKKMLSALQKGVKPLPCKGKEECDSYCSTPEHTEECIAFAEAAGFMSPEDAEMARKTGGAGPGGCKGQEECEAFCQNPENQETCFNFAKEHGMMSEDDLRRAEGGLGERGEGLGRMQEALNQAPPQVLDCLKQNLGEEVVSKVMAGDASVISQSMGEAMKSCFESMMPQGGPEGMIGEGGPGGQGGPGGCQTPEECQAYCQAHPEECGGQGGGSVEIQQFSSPASPPVGGPPPGGFSGPGGCRTPQECEAFCLSNPQQCAGFQAPQSPSSTGIPQQFSPPQEFMPPQEFAPPQGQIIPQEFIPQGEPMPQEQPMPATESGANLFSAIKTLLNKFIRLF